MSERSTLTILAEEVANALAPLAEAISSPENFTAFMQELGWNLTTVPQPFRDLSAPSAPLQDIIDIVEAGTVDSSNVGDLISAIKALITALKDLKGNLTTCFPLPSTPKSSRMKSRNSCSGFSSSTISLTVVLSGAIYLRRWACCGWKWWTPAATALPTGKRKFYGTG